MEYKNLCLLILAFVVVSVQAEVSASNVENTTNDSGLMLPKDMQECIKKLVSYLTKGSLISMLISNEEMSKFVCSIINIMKKLMSNFSASNILTSNIFTSAS